jgi:hypothetical protein
MTGKKILALFLLLSLALSAFRPPAQPRPDPNAKMIMQFLAVINPDGSAEFRYIIKYSRDQVNHNLKSGGYSEDELCANTTAKIESSIGTFTQEKHGEDIWCTDSIDMQNLKGLSNHLKDDFSLTVQRLEIADGKFYLDLAWNSFPCTTPNPADFTCEFSVQAPGAVGTNNATRVKGNTLTWDMSDSGTPLHFKAESAVGGLDFTLLTALAIMTCCCCLVIVLIGGGIAAYLILRNRKLAPAAPEPSAAPEPILPAGPPLQP